MLSNNDFANLIKSGADFSREDGKTRFDMKQVQQWDKQNRQQDKRKAVKKNVFGDEDDEEDKKKNDVLPPGYRDRALERRKGVQDEEAAQLEEMAAKMDAEQSKFMGGDIEHTHLVKGLDFALASKVRQQLLQQEAEQSSDQDESAGEEEEEEQEGKHELKIITAMGHRLHKLLFKVPEAQPAVREEKQAFVRIDIPPRATSSSAAAAGNAQGREVKTLSKAGQALSRVVYEMDLKADMDAVPVTVIRAAKDTAAPDDQRICYALPKPLRAKVEALYEGGQMKPRSQRRKEALPPGLPAGTRPTAPAPTPAAAPSSASAAKVSSLYDDDMYGDEPIGRYDPSGSSSATGSSAKGLFSSLRDQSYLPPPPAPSSSSSVSKGGLMGLAADPALRGDSASNAVKGLLQAQARRDYASLHTTADTSTASHSRGNPKAKAVVYRDVFASTADKVVELRADALQGKKGDSFGLYGSYDDIYPESTVMDVGSDDEGQAAGTGAGARKRPKLTDARGK